MKDADEGARMADSTIPLAVKDALEEAMASCQAGNLKVIQADKLKTIQALLNDDRMPRVYRYFTVQKFSGDQINRFLAKAVTLAYPVKLKSPLFTLREIKRAPAKKRAVMEWHPVAPGSPHPAVATYLAMLATVARAVFGTYCYGTVATVADVILNTATPTTEKQVRSALRIFARPGTKVRL